MMGSSKRAKSTAGWTTLEDIDNDLCEFSEIAVNHDDMDEPPLATIVQYKAQMSAIHNSSIFDTHMPYEDVTYISSGRGRGGFSKFYRPGVPVNDCDQEIYRKIREVSGVGYSNEIIEKTLRAKLGKPENAADSDFSDAPSLSEETAPATNGHANRKLTNGHADRRQTNGRTGDDTPRSANSTPKLDESPSAEPNRPENGVDQRPPPLSEMLKRARKKNAPSLSSTKVEAVTDSYARIALEPAKTGAKSISPANKAPMANGGVSRIEAESGSDSGSASATPTSDTSYNTAEDNSWWRKSRVEPGSSSSDEPLSWRKKSPDNRYFQNDWRRRSPKKDNFNINSAKDFPAL